MSTTMADGDTRALVAFARLLRAEGYAFTTPTPLTHARVNARPGADRARSLRDVFGWSRAFAEGVLPERVFEAARVAEVLARDGGLWRSRVRVSSLGGLLFMHSAYPTTAADSVFFGPDTYRFCNAVADHLAARGRVGRAVDIGCGAGPAAVLIARAWPEAEVIGADVNPAALRLAEVNASLAGVRVTCRRSDLLAACPGVFDLVVANPPYLVDPAERAYRHGGGPLGAGLSLSILSQSLGRLAPGGTLLLYTGAAIVDGFDPFLAAADAVLRDGPFIWSYREVDPDVFGEELESGVYAQADRIAAVVLTVTRPVA